ncbi:hypothetical protein TM7_0066 [candidate division TM7 genomosp. GTL1]|nr:hypothetical protein TM7_0582 [candidate division TM7 genomosp. GTL1]EDK72766.1 hypothetical protein TM7_0066 [candidate division TM7 genomosp. GTL1]
MVALKRILVVPLLLLATLSMGVLLAAPAYAGDTSSCGTGEGGVRTTFDFGCPGGTNAKAKNLEQNPIYAVLIYGVNALAAGVGVVVAGSIIWNSIQWASANGQPDKVKNARNGIVNAIIGLMLFLTMYAILNFLIPGGIFQ